MTYRFFFSSWNHSWDFVQISSSLMQLRSGFKFSVVYVNKFIFFKSFKIPKYSKWELKMVLLPKEPFHLLFRARNNFLWPVNYGLAPFTSDENFKILTLLGRITTEFSLRPVKPYDLLFRWNLYSSLFWVLKIITHLKISNDVLVSSDEL